MTDDLISRQAAIKAIEDLQDCYNGFSDTYDKACIIGVLEDLTSAQPGPRRGRWLAYENTAFCVCSNCWFLTDRYPFYHYCPNCGARMEESDDADT